MIPPEFADAFDLIEDIAQHLATLSPEAARVGRGVLMATIETRELEIREERARASAQGEATKVTPIGTRTSGG